MLRSTQAFTLFILFQIVMLGGLSFAVYADQPETSAVCDEAQEPIALNYGDHTTLCGFATGSDQDSFTFVGDIGDEVNINLRTLTDRLDPYISLRDSSGLEIATNSCSSSFTCGFVIAQTLPETGTYTVIVGETGLDESGDYVLAVEKLFPTLNPVALTYDVPVSDRLEPGVDQDFFEFNGQAGDEIHINLRTLTDRLDPYISLRDSSGLEIATNSCSSSFTCGFVIAQTLPETGTYTVIVGETGLDEAGDYVLVVEKLFPTLNPVALTYDVPVSDRLEPGVDQDFFEFNGQAGDEIHINLRTLTDRLDPYISLRDSSGLEIATNSCSSSFTCGFVINQTLPETGTYTLIVGETGLDESGDYEITIQCTGVCPIPNNPPDVTNPGLQINQEGDAIALQIVATDADPLVYFVSGLPAGLTINAATGLISGTLAFNAEGNYTVIVSVSDNVNPLVEIVFTWQVANKNRNPEIAPLGNQNLPEGTNLTVAVTATDPDGDPVTLSVSNLPAFGTFTDNGNGTGSLSFKPDFSQANTYTITVNAADNQGGADAKSFMLTVTDAPAPVIELNVNELNFGEVIKNTSASLFFTIGNSGESPLVVDSIDISGLPFSILSPTAFTINPGDIARVVEIGFNPTEINNFTGIVTINNNTGTAAVVNLLGEGIAAPGVGNIEAVGSLEFGPVFNEGLVEQIVTINNIGEGPLVIENAEVDNPKFLISTLPTGNIPVTINPGDVLDLRVQFSPDMADAGSTINAELIITSDDSDTPIRVVAISAAVIAAPEELSNTILGARVHFNPFDLITAATCGNVGGQVTFSANSSSADEFKIILTHESGETVESNFFPALDGSGVALFSGMDTCAMPDGVIDVKAVLLRDSVTFPSVPGTPAVKHTLPLEPPVLDALPPFTLNSFIEVCGTSRPDTTVMIAGGASTVSIDLDDVTADFCLNVPLRRNEQNTLIASAIDNLSIEPKPIASAQPVQIVQADPATILIAKAYSRPLTDEETDALVAEGVIDPDEAANSNVSMFTIVLTIGGSPRSYSQVVVLPPNSPGSTFYGRGGPVSGSTWSPGSLSSSTPNRPQGCMTNCGQIVLIKTESGQYIPGVIIIDGRIKTLKEFFQVTLAISNTSTLFELSDMTANVNVAAGLTPIKAGVGLDVANINIDSDVDTVDLGVIQPGETGIGQFILRGDGIGQHRIDVEFGGNITSSLIPTLSIPVSGSASTDVEVLGPPELRVTVHHPHNPAGADVSFGQQYDVLVEIENVSDRPARYTSLELFVGGGAVLVDAEGIEIPGSSQTESFGLIPAGGKVERTFRLKSLLEGDIIACQAIAAENIILTVNTGTDCNIVNTFPANFEPLPADDAPVVIGINPINGQPSIPITSSVFASFTPQTDCLIADAWQNVVTAPIDPLEPNKGIQVISADLVDTGTFYLEELDALEQPVRHVPVDLTVVDPPAGGTTIAVLRLGLDAPLSQYFLKPDTSYRATILGGQGGVCSAASSLTMRNTFRWTFTTVDSCNALEPPSVNLLEPTEGAIDRPLNQPIVLEFTQRDQNTGIDSPAQMDTTSFISEFGNIPQSTFGVYRNAVIENGDITGADPVAGSFSFNDSQDRLTFIPDDGALQEGDTVVIRLTDRINDACANPLQTPPVGAVLFSFQVVLPDTTAPDKPVVNPVPVLTKEPSITMTGMAESGSTVEITGGALTVSVVAESSGAFVADIPLLPDQSNAFQVKAIDANGNVSPSATNAIDGSALVTTHDGTPPQLLGIAPFDGEADVPVGTSVTVAFNEPLDPATINSSHFVLQKQGSGISIQGSIVVNTASEFTFTPAASLEFGTAYLVRMQAGGISDVIGNAIADDIVTTFTTEDFMPVQTIFDLTARAKDSKIDIVWTPVAGAESYNIYRSESAGGPYSLVAQGHVTDYAVYADFGLTNGITYCYVVTSNASGIESAQSNEACATPVAGRTRRR